MALSARFGLMTLAVALAIACGETSSDSTGTDASSDASNPADAKNDPAAVDPNCHDGDVLWDLPTGSCVEGASCEIQRKSKCPDGTVLVYPAHWACKCQGDTWSCENIGGGLNLPMCPDAGTDAGVDAGDATD
ncbi:MAG: hypothetical protein IPM35_41305 [Myxococcales bacterium]|nr:hypothetical protein [Myxococcales bacterium]